MPDIKDQIRILLEAKYLGKDKAITVEEDTRRYASNFWSRITSMIARAKKVDEIGTKEFLKGQMEMFQ